MNHPPFSSGVAVPAEPIFRMVPTSLFWFTHAVAEKFFIVFVPSPAPGDDSGIKIPPTKSSHVLPEPVFPPGKSTASPVPSKSNKVNEAVKAKEAEIEAELAERVEGLEEQYKTEIEEGLNEARDGLVDKIDSYLNYVVETWMEENKLAIEKGLRTEIAETFMNNLKELFKESYIQVPESKVDLVDDLVDQVETLEDEVNKKTEEALAMREAANQMKRTMVIREASKDLAETQKEKLEKLAEGVDFSDEETFAKKIATLKETYFAENAEKAVEAVEAAAEKVDEVTEESGDETSVEVSSVMEKYLTAIRNQS